MHTLLQELQKKYQKKSIPDLRPGMTVKVTHKFLDGEKERSQIFQGVVIKKHEKKSLNATVTVRKVVDGIGVEKIFPLHSTMAEFEIVKAGKVRRAKLYYMRERTGKSARIRDIKDATFKEIHIHDGVAEKATEAPKEEAKTEEKKDA